MRYALLGAAAVLLCAEARAEHVSMEPSTSWVLDYAENKCRMLRTFGTGDRQMLLLLEQHSPADTFTWTLAGDGLQGMFLERGFHFQFGPALKPVRVDSQDSKVRRFGHNRPYTAMLGELEGVGHALVHTGYKLAADPGNEEEAAEPVGLPHLDVAEGGQIEWLRLDRGAGRSLTLNTGNMRAPFDALNKCASDLAAS